jgi:hypothetical protein
MLGCERKLFASVDFPALIGAYTPVGIGCGRVFGWLAVNVQVRFLGNIQRDRE